MRIWLALALLIFPLASVADEALCVSPPSGYTCLGGEPMNTNSHDDGVVSWEWGLSGWSDPGVGASNEQKFDPDDSTDANEIFDSLWHGGAFGQPEMQCTTSPGIIPVTAASESAFLPSGHTNSYVLRYRGSGGTCHTSHPSNIHFDKSTGSTFCVRHYSRWDAASTMPPPAAGSPSGEPQQKVSTIGGCVNACVDATYAIRNQISIIPETGGIVGRLGYSADITVAGLSSGSAQNIGTVPDDCTINYCRFEICLDYATSGEVSVRAKVTELTPGSGEVHQINVVDTGNIAASWDLVAAESATGMVWFTQDTPGIIRYSAYFIAMQGTYDTSWWPGPASEFEGGSSTTVRGFNRVAP